MSVPSCNYATRVYPPPHFEDLKHSLKNPLPICKRPQTGRKAGESEQPLGGGGGHAQVSVETSRVDVACPGPWPGSLPRGRELVCYSHFIQRERIVPVWASFPSSV